MLEAKPPESWRGQEGRRLSWEGQVERGLPAFKMRNYKMTLKHQVSQVQAAENPGDVLG